MPDWPPGGEVPPQLLSHLEWPAKRAIQALRRRTRPSEAAPIAFDAGAVYRTLGRSGVNQGLLVKRMFRRAGDPGEAVDITFAALIAAIAAGDAPRARGLAEFLPLCYTGAALDAGVTRVRRQLEALDADQQAIASGIKCGSDWEAFAASVRERIDAMPPREMKAERHRLPSIPPRRVVLRVSGGLGNQLFQYAAGLAYARRVGAPLRLDLANYVGDRREREFLLGRLRVPVRRANSFEVLWARLRPHWQRGGALDHFLLEDHGSGWLNGYWENAAYFADVLPTVLRRFAPRDPLVSRGAAALVERARISAGPVIGVHLRRGDRAPGGTAFAPLSTLPPGYYREAASRFPADANFLVFSDTPEDIAWCRSHLGLGDKANVTFGEGRDPIRDMFALVRSDHVILSGGTFSWWAGYLGQRTGRRVIVPNVLQALSAEWASIPGGSFLQEWEQVTVRPENFN